MNVFCCGSARLALSFALLIVEPWGVPILFDRP